MFLALEQIKQLRCAAVYKIFKKSYKAIKKKQTVFSDTRLILLSDPFYVLTSPGRENYRTHSWPHFTSTGSVNETGSMFTEIHWLFKTHLLSIFLLNHQKYKNSHCGYNNKNDYFPNTTSTKYSPLQLVEAFS